MGNRQTRRKKERLLNKLADLAKRVDADRVDSMTLPVMPRQCKTCPFGENGIEQTRQTVESRLGSGGQICHHHELNGLPQRFICRGAFEVQAHAMYQLGVIEAPTLEAWDKQRREMGMPERNRLEAEDMSGKGFRTRQRMGIPRPHQIKTRDN